MYRLAFLGGNASLSVLTHRALALCGEEPTLLSTQRVVLINLSEVMTKSHHHRLWPLVFRFEVIGEPRPGVAREVGV